MQSNNYLFYFKSPEDSEPRGSIPLEEVEVVPQAQDGDGKGIFLVHHKDNFSYYLKSEDGPEDIDDWVESIKWAKYSALKVRVRLSSDMLHRTHAAGTCDHADVRGAGGVLSPRRHQRQAQGAAAQGDRASQRAQGRM
eukprot:COSAG01_NODE_2136_length_8334_cov_319.754706_6_plen_138_part_00